MVAQILRRFTVFTQGYDTGFKATMGKVLTQGGPELPRPFQDLYGCVDRHRDEGLHSANARCRQFQLQPTACLRGRSRSPSGVYPEIDVETATALRAAKGWARRTGMKFNLAERKRGILVRRGSAEDEEGRAIGDEIVFGSAEEVYLGVAVKRVDATNAAVLRRAHGAQAAFRFLIFAKILVFEA